VRAVTLRACDETNSCTGAVGVEVLLARQHEQTTQAERTRRWRACLSLPHASSLRATFTRKCDRAPDAVY
jgi:hypothetical protein